MSNCNSNPTSGCTENLLAIQLKIKKNEVDPLFLELEVILDDILAKLIACCMETNGNLTDIYEKLVQVLAINVQCCEDININIEAIVTALCTLSENIEPCDENPTTEEPEPEVTTTSEEELSSTTSEEEVSTTTSEEEVSTTTSEEEVSTTTSLGFNIIGLNLATGKEGGCSDANGGVVINTIYLEFTPTLFELGGDNVYDVKTSYPNLIPTEVSVYNAGEGDIISGSPYNGVATVDALEISHAGTYVIKDSDVTDPGLVSYLVVTFEVDRLVARLEVCEPDVTTTSSEEMTTTTSKDLEDPV